MTKKDITKIVQENYLETFRKDEKFRALVVYLAFSRFEASQWISPEDLSFEFQSSQNLEISAYEIRQYAVEFPAWIDYKRIGETATTVDTKQPIDRIRPYSHLKHDWLKIAQHVLLGTKPE